MISISRPIHTKYALRSVNDATYINFVNGYSLAKKIGVKGVWIYISGSGVRDICVEALKGQMRTWGRRKLAASLISSATWACTPLVSFVTNSTKIIKVANATHTTIAFVAETCEDCTNLAWLPLDMCLCGQPIPIGDGGRYNLMGGDHSIISFLGSE